MSQLRTRVKSVDRYLQLVTEFPLRRIRNEREHQQAKRMFRRLSAGKADSATHDFLEILVDLIVAYEDRVGLRPDRSHISAADIVRHLLAERGLSVNACAKTIGAQQSDLSNMLNGRRDWSKAMMLKLADFLGLEPGLFLKRP